MKKKMILPLEIENLILEYIDSHRLYLIKQRVHLELRHMWMIAQLKYAAQVIWELE